MHFLFEMASKLPMIGDPMIRKAWSGQTTKAWPAETEAASPTGCGAGLSIAAQKEFDKVQLPMIKYLKAFGRAIYLVTKLNVSPAFGRAFSYRSRSSRRLHVHKMGILGGVTKWVSIFRNR